LVGSAAELHDRFAVPSVLRVGEKPLHGEASVHRQNVAAHAGGIRAEKPHGGAVDAENHALFVHQDQTFAHAVGDGGKFILFPFQFIELAADLSMLMLDARQKRGEFLIGIVFKRVIEVERIERLNDLFGKPVCEHRGENERDAEHDADRPEHAEHQCKDRILTDRYAQDGTVGQQFSIIARLFPQALSRRAHFLRSGFQRLLDFSRSA
jgi:hypothetical protein